MPMFQEPFEPREAGEEGDSIADPQLHDSLPGQVLAGLTGSLARRVSEESIRTELCEGPIPDSPPPMRLETPEKPTSNAVSDRAELIERLKRGESPTWVPNRHLESLFHQSQPASPPPRTPQRLASASPALLPPPTITPEKPERGADDIACDRRLQEGLNIERPRSALHSGDFTPEESPPRSRDVQDGPAEDAPGTFRPPAVPWTATSPPRDYQPFVFGRATAEYRREAFNPSGASSLSSSFSSSFIYKPPTSPLVQSESNDDLDLSLPLNSINIANNSPRNPRRHTLSFSLSQSSPFSSTLGQKQGLPRREGAHPYQAHQPRRSLASTPSFSFADSAPQTPFLRPRRPSLGPEASPLQHASMVGSYEESILRGRMSTTPSKPLDFMAQIGVLGLGKCKSSLRCPPHVTLPFSAVFYSYASTVHGRSKTEDGPSPYVGQIDLENGLTAPDEGQQVKRKSHVRHPERADEEEDVPMQGNTTGVSEVDARKSAKRKRRSRSPKPPPPGGRYRIPEKGQLQIIIKNQNKTAVKLFLVPYDLAGMEPGTKTFVRQRSYSAGPIIENIPDTEDATGTNDRPILRYLIHLHICCPSKGRFYLYKSIRVVFANRVPDGKERLRNEITHPEPRFTPYKAVRVMHPQSSLHSSGPGAALAAEKAFRRRSAGFSFAQNFPTLTQASLASEKFNIAPAGTTAFALPLLKTRVADSGGDTVSSPAAPHWRAMPGAQQEAADGWPAASMEMASPLGRYDKLSKGDIGYGGNAFVPVASPGGTEGLLSKRLKSLGVQGSLSGNSTEGVESEGEAR